MRYDGWIYGMRTRFCPDGQRGMLTDETGRYHSIVWCKRELSMAERLHYGLDYLGRGTDGR